MSNKEGIIMKENILDYLLADPSYTLCEVVDIIDFHMQGADPHVVEEVKEDLKHAFSN